MPKQARIKTKYPGVYYIEADGARGKEKIFYIFYRRKGKQIEEKAGGQYSDDMTDSKASAVRADRMRGKAPSNTEKRCAERAAKAAQAGKWTLTKLWDEYSDQKQKSRSLRIDETRFRLHLEPTFGAKVSSELQQLEVDRLRVNLLKVKSPQTVKHVLGLLKRLCNFGVKKQLCLGIGFKIEMPRVDNQTTEDLSTSQLKKLLDAIDQSSDRTAAAFMKMALFTGMRRGELIKLQWRDVDFDRGFILIRDPKGGVSQRIPLNDQARGVLENQPKMKTHVFLRDNGLPLTTIINRRVRAIKEAAGLPADFRPLHGLRHAFASMLASSGQVDMYTLQKLLTHKSPIMTQRYAHLRDDALKRASSLAGSIIDQVTKTDSQETEK